MTNFAYSPVSYTYNVISTLPIALPFSVDDLRQQAKIDRDDATHNTWIENFIIRPVVAVAENETSKIFITREFETFRDNFNILQINRSPFIEITKFEYYDLDKIWQEIPAEDYYVDIRRQEGFIFPTNGSFPSFEVNSQLSSVKITFKSGYGETAQDVLYRQADVIKAMMQHAVFWYQNRGDCCKQSLSIPADVLRVYRSNKKASSYGLQRRG